MLRQNWGLFIAGSSIPGMSITDIVKLRRNIEPQFRNIRRLSRRKLNQITNVTKDMLFVRIFL
jgi:N-glycosylase/DNA lyase